VLRGNYASTRRPNIYQLNYFGGDSPSKPIAFVFVNAAAPFSKHGEISAPLGVKKMRVAGGRRKTGCWRNW